MKYYEKLSQMGTFEMKDMIAIINNASTVKSVLKEYLGKGYIIRVKKNLYAAVNLSTGNTFADRYQIGCAVAEDAYLSHHSAAEYYGFANQVFNEIYVTTKKKIVPFEYNNTRYTFVSPELYAGVISPETRRGIRVTDTEKTILDCINNMDRAGGLEEVLKIIESVTYLNEQKLIEYLNEFDKKFLYQKVGYMLEKHANDLRLSQKFFEHCQSNIGKSKRYLIAREELLRQEYNSKWNLIVEGRLSDILGQGGGELV
ncbi:MAG: hypothetical protein A2Y24_04700 [Clostridiales bacterium GWE2_32_10]|nr:MAG: hypothetical protein A2Y24_04700 [Clostridiales bacterium GWE2_32_10]HBY21557.1 transcriptional regulator [Clostridiales bacterium]